MALIERVSPYPFPKRFRNLEEVYDYLLKLYKALGMGNSSFIEIFHNGVNNVFKPLGAAWQAWMTTGTSMQWGWPGTASVVLGENALAGGTAANIKGGIIIGEEAGYKLTTPAFSDTGVIIGYQAAYDATTAYDNVIIGDKTAANLTTGYRNVAIGDSTTGAALTSGRYNVLLGFQSGYAITTGYGNVFLGYNSGISHTGDKNVCIGYGAGIAVGASYDAVIIGTNSGINKDGTECVYVGAYSGGGSSTPGGYDTTVGAYAGYGIAAGTYNTAIGHSSGFGLVGGSYNICAGYMAGGRLSINGSNNIYIGDYAGYGTSAAARTPAGNICVGSYAGSSIQSGTGNVMIGNLAGKYETGSNKFFVDNQDRTTEALGRTNSLLYGTFNASVDSQILAVNGQLQIGVSAAISPITTASSVLVSNLNADMVDGVHASALVGSHAILDGSVHTDSLVGTVVLGDIVHGNATPRWAKLAGNITTTKKWLAQTGTGAISAVPAWDTIGTGDVPYASHHTSAIDAALTDAHAQLASLHTDASPTFAVVLAKQSGDHVSNYTPVFITQHSRGSIASPTAVLSGDILGSMLIGGHDGTNWTSGWDGGAALLAYAGESWTPTARGAGFRMETTPLGTTGWQIALDILPSGNVGINDSNPAERLDVNGNINVAGVYKVADSQIAQANIVGLTTGDSPIFVTVKCSGLTDGYIPYHVADATGLANGPIYTDGSKIGIGNTYLNATKLSLGNDVGVKILLYDGGTSAQGGNGYFGGIAVDKPAGNDVSLLSHNDGRVVLGKFTNNNDLVNVTTFATFNSTELDVLANINATGVYKVDDVQVVSNRVIDARCDDAIDSGDATTDGVIDALRDAMIAHGLIAAS